LNRRLCRAAMALLAQPTPAHWVPLRWPKSPPGRGGQAPTAISAPDEESNDASAKARISSLSPPVGPSCEQQQQQQQQQQDTARSSTISPPSSRGELPSVACCESFDVELGTANFTVRCWRARGNLPSRHELTVLLKIRGSVANDAGRWKPVLVWDVRGNPSFAWSPPPLPGTLSGHDVDHVRRCICTHFVTGSSPGSWVATLVWPSQTAPSAPSSISALIRTPDGRRITHPVHGRSFDVQLRREGQEQQPVCEIGEVREAREEVERLRARASRAETAFAAWAEAEADVQQQLCQRPAAEEVAELRARLHQEISHRRRCQADLVELRGRPRSFCLLCGPVATASRAGTSLLEWRSRTEVVMTPAQQRFQFDHVLSARAGVEAAWEELGPALEAALRAPGGHGCIVVCNDAQRKRPAWESEHVAPSAGYTLMARAVRHFFSHMTQDCSLTAPAAGAPSSKGVAQRSVAMSWAEADQDQLYDLLQEASPRSHRQLYEAQDGTPSRMRQAGAQQLGVLYPGTVEEALDELEQGQAARRGLGHGILSLCMWQRDVRVRQATTIVRLCLVDLGELPGDALDTYMDPACSADDGSNPRLQAFASVTKLAQECLDWTEAFLGGNTSFSPRLILVAHISTLEEELAASLSVLQLIAAAQTMFERAALLRPESEQSRKQLARLAEENARLREEYQEKFHALHRPQSCVDNSGTQTPARGEPVVGQGSPWRSPGHGWLSARSNCRSPKRSPPHGGSPRRLPLA